MNEMNRSELGDTKQMTFLDLIGERQSTRCFSTEAVDLNMINECIEAARVAPSACNSQPWKIHVVKQRRIPNNF